MQTVTLTKDRPVLSSERALHNNKTNCQTVINIWSWAPDRGLDTKTDWLTDWLTDRPSVAMWLWLWLVVVVTFLSSRCLVTYAYRHRLMEDIYEVCHSDGPRCHDIHTIKIDLGIQKLVRGKGHRHKQYGNLISLVSLFFKIRKVGTKHEDSYIFDCSMESG
jgi:hypothetical protein